MRKLQKYKLVLLLLLFLAPASISSVSANPPPKPPASTATDSPEKDPPNAAGPTDTSTAKYQCGSGKDAVKVSIDIGCKGNSCLNGHPEAGFDCDHQNSPVLDAAFAIIRFLTAGVGLIIVASLVVAGIQYTSSRGDPGATAAAMNRIRSTVIALFIFIFGFAILNYLIPAGFFK